jgi:hypothetical protein
MLIKRGANRLVKFQMVLQRIRVRVQFS